MPLKRKKKKVVRKGGVTDPVDGLGKEHGVSFLGEVIATQTEVLEAFRAKYNCEPEEVVMLKGCDDHKSYYWYLQKRKK